MGGGGVFTLRQAVGKYLSTGVCGSGHNNITTTQASTLWAQEERVSRATCVIKVSGSRVRS